MAELPDYVRYAAMFESVLKPMFARIRSLKPDFVVSSGDFVEGGMRDTRKTWREMEAGWGFMKTLQCPVIIAKGTHEGSGSHPGATAYREIVLPGMSEMIGHKIEKNYFRFEKNGNVFFLLDYLEYHAGNEQDAWLECELRRSSEKGQRIFIVAHPPLYNWGRHFFNEPAFVNRIAELCRTYPVDGYLCGHTHNQTFSFHESGNGKGFVQITGSSVGYPHMDLRALDEFHVLADFTAKDHFIWGIHEDSSPGFHLIDVDGTGMTVEWNSFKGDSASAVIKARRFPPCEIKAPSYRKLEKLLNDIDIHQIKSGLLHIYGSYGSKSSKVSINGISLGNLPTNSSYAARRFLHLSSEALKSVTKRNTISITLPDKGDFVLGSLSLELLLVDNRIIHSEVSPKLFVHGERFSEFPKPRAVTKAVNGQTVSLALSL